MIVLATGLWGGAGCRKAEEPPRAGIEFTRIPKADVSGSDKHDIIEGRVSGAAKGQHVVLYARNGSWWLQPRIEAPLTRVAPSGKWTNATHLGSEYAALLVSPEYKPPANVDSLPRVGGLVTAVKVTKGADASPSPTIQFSGYEWRVRTAASNRGGRSNPYSAESAWIDSSGALHLRIRKKREKFECAEIALTRSLGYGSYSFLVRDTSKLPPGLTLEMFTWDYSGADQNNREMDIVVRRWPVTKKQSTARFIVQPFQVASNKHEFDLPAGAYLHSLRWEAGQAQFSTSSADGRKRIIAQRNFTLGIPTPGLESARIAFYVPNAVAQPADGEVVIERFEFTP